MGVEERWPLTGADGLRDRLVAAYADPRRAYHDLRHLEEVLQRLAELDPRAPDALVLAAWFHDAVYDGDRDDEDRSAQLAETELASAGLPAAVVAEVARLVRTTERHRPADDDLAGQLLCDADLAVLAADDERYAGYVAGVRREYAEVPDQVFRDGRRAVLEDLLAKESLFHTARARELWEERARANVTAEVAALSAPADPR